MEWKLSTKLKKEKEKQKRKTEKKTNEEERIPFKGMMKVEWF